MKKIATLLLFLISAVVLVNCRKKTVAPVATESEDDRAGRPGPGYNWRLSTPKQSDPAEYVESPNTRQYFLKESAKYTRILTLKITKTGESISDPAFRLYGKDGDCLTMSTPTVSMGEATTTKFYTEGSPVARVGYSWSVPMATSPVGATAMLTVIVSGTTASCTEGIILADMISPVVIASVGYYYDLDALGFVRKSGF